MELEAAKMIGAGLAAIALAGAGVGIGIIFGNYLSGAMRNPSAAQKAISQFTFRICSSRSNWTFWSCGCFDYIICILKINMRLIKPLIIFTLCFENELISAEAGMPQLDSKYWLSQSFWLILIFTILYLTLSKFFIPKIKDNLDSRERKIKENLDSAKELSELSEKKNLDYKNEMEKAKKRGN